MLSNANQGITKTKYLSDNQIIVPSAPHFAVGIVVDQTAGTEDEATGRTIVKAGTPLTGNLDARTTAFTKAVTSGSPTATSNVVGILQHDVDVTVDDGNGELLLIGVVNVNRLDTDVQALITAEVKAALPTVKLIKL